MSTGCTLFAQGTDRYIYATLITIGNFGFFRQDDYTFDAAYEYMS